MTVDHNHNSITSIFIIKVGKGGHASFAPGLVGVMTVRKVELYSHLKVDAKGMYYFEIKTTI